MSALNANNDQENPQLLGNTFPVDVRLLVDRRSNRRCPCLDNQRLFALGDRVGWLIREVN
jgi:hypothetical protein